MRGRCKNNNALKYEDKNALYWSLKMDLARKY